MGSKFVSEKTMYLSNNLLKRLYKRLTFHPDYLFYKAVKIFNKYNYFKLKKNKIGILWYGFKANRIASKYNLELYGNFGKNLRIWHGNIVINGRASLGDNVQLHGNNCIGNDGITDECPKIGNNVDIGYGSIIIGNITIADNVKIGANSLVNKDCLEENVILIGSPAIKRKIKNEN